jgi:hypothetical protein
MARYNLFGQIITLKKNEPHGVWPTGYDSHFGSDRYVVESSNVRRGLPELFPAGSQTLLERNHGRYHSSHSK